MKTVHHPSDSRGLADHGWLKSRHTFSFAEYIDPERMNFGALRVLNDDIVEGGHGFDAHPHKNMEIISIPLSGVLQHEDNMGNVFTLKPNDIQVMSAGTGVIHSEKNASDSESSFLQIWITPKHKDIEPRYEQRTFLSEERKNRFKTIISPDSEDNALGINQDAYLAIGTFEEGREAHYQMHIPRNGVYIFVIEGALEVFGKELNRRDGLGISDTQHLRMRALADSEVLIIEIPMTGNGIGTE